MTGVEVDVIPLEPADLAAAQAAEQDKAPHNVEAAAGSGGQERRCLLRAPYLGLAAAPPKAARPLRMGCTG